MQKSFEIWKIVGFLSFSVSIWDFFIYKTAIIPSKKPTGQQNVSFWPFKTFESKKTVEILSKNA